MNYAAAFNETTADRYPYTSGSGGTTGTCNSALIAATPVGQAIRLSGGAGLVWPTNNEAALMAAVAAAPTTVYFEAQTSFQMYAGGVYMATADCGASLNHAMLAVGYNWTGDSASSYWILKNSWGSGWGEGGYFRIAMTGDGIGPCGM